RRWSCGSVQRRPAEPAQTRSGCCEPQVDARSVERDPELLWIAPDLCEEEAALDACHGCGREFGGIGAWLEPGARFHAAEADSEMGLPAVVETVRDRCSGQRVGPA